MEIHLPDIQPFFEKIKNGSVTAVRIPKTEIKAGELLTAFSSSGNGSAVKLKVLSTEAASLEAVTAEEAEREGFTVPDFCPSQFLCGNIETRLDFEAYVFKYENNVPIARSEAEREAYLRERVQRICPSCLTRKNARELFLNYWKPKMTGSEMTRIRFEVTG
jgi:uncharacterized protein YqfB (UPF0267 family)